MLPNHALDRFRVATLLAGRRCALQLLCAWMLTHAVADAQAPSDLPRAEELRSAVDVNAEVKRGIELRRQGKDAEALEVFRAALARAPSSHRIRVHLATAHQALGQWQEAQRHLQEVLQYTEDPYIARHYDELTRALADVSDRLGTVEILGTPAGADVFVSGRRIGALPLAAFAMPTGSYELEVRMPGHYPAVRSLLVTSRGFHRERLELRPLLVERGPAAAPSRAGAASHTSETARSRWVIGALAGVGGASAVTAVVALILRESYASHWNSDACLGDQRTRIENCASHLERGRTAGYVALASGIGAGLLLGTAAALAWLPDESEHPAARSSTGCFAAMGGVACTTSF